MLKRTRFHVISWILAALICTGNLCAEILPETGTFDGIYHRDRWGVGRFKFFVVEEQLHEQFAKYEGRRIRVHVTQGIQMVNPGPVFMQATGSITRLPEPPLGIRIELVPPDPAPREPFQLVCRFENLSEKACIVSRSEIIVQVHSSKPTGWPEKPSFFHRTENATYEWSTSAGNQLVVAAPIHYGHLAPGERIAIPPGKSIPLAIVFDHGLPHAEYEIAVTARGSEEANGERWHQHTVWMDLDLEGMPRERELSRPLRIASKSIRTIRDGYELQVKLVAEPGEARSIMVPRGNAKRSWAGRLRAFTAEGNELEIRNNQGALSLGPWHLEQIAEAGHDIKLEFRQEKRFTGERIHRMVLDLLTDRGVESFEVANGFRDVHAVVELPPFGASLQGVKLRARPAGKSFRLGQTLRFHMQAVNESGKPVIWRMSTPTPAAAGESLRIEIDGKEIELPRRADEYVYGWGGSDKRMRPYEWTCILPPSLKIGPGTHTFRYSIVSSSGVYRNSRNVDVPVIKGTLRSNTIEFRVLE